MNRIQLSALLLATSLTPLPAGALGPFVEADAVALYTLAGESVGDGFGWVGNDLGDLDGDGVHDLIVTAPFRGDPGPRAGKVYVYSGATGALLAAHTGEVWDAFGWSAAAAGDVDADGVPDYVVGGPGSGGPQVPQPFLGRLTVYSGSDHSVILDVRGNVGERLGSAVVGAGDVDGDGHDDVLGCANFASVGAAATGRCDLYSGADGSILWSRAGDPGVRLGGGAGRLGDVDGDGTPDLSAAAAFAGPSQGGEAYVLSGVDGGTIHTLRPSPLGTAQLFGVFFASGAGDVDGDGTTDVYVGDYASGYRGPAGTGQAFVFSGATGALMHRFDADRPLDGVGPGRGTGDVNGDGFADLIVAAYTANDGGPAAGKATLFSGFDGSVLRTITGAVANDNLGVDAFALGDVNGDAAIDLVLTAVGLDFSLQDVGRVYVVAGNP